MTKTEMIAAAKAAAIAHELDQDLVCAIVERETSWNPWKIRYEPAFFQKYVVPLYTAGKFDITEAKARSISWGLMQIIGETARERGYTGELAMLADPLTGLHWGCELFSHKLALAGHDLQKALEEYNGGSNPNYASEVLAYRPKFVNA